jgi:hypothetical protein
MENQKAKINDIEVSLKLSGNIIGVIIYRLNRYLFPFNNRNGILIILQDFI